MQPKSFKTAPTDTFVFTYQRMKRRHCRILTALVIVLIFFIMHAFRKLAYDKIYLSNFQQDLDCSSFLINQTAILRDDDSCLIRHISKTIIQPEDKSHFTISDLERHFSQVGQDKMVDELLHGKRGGFFIECGAGNGKRLSNTLFLERARQWTGLLIEANPDLFKEILIQNRSAYLVNNCLSLERWPSKMMFQMAKMVGGLVEGFEPQHARFLKETNKIGKQLLIQCYPLYSILLAVNTTHVDYLSLDVEGPELNILKTIPFDKVVIDVMTVEFKILKPHNHKLAVDYKASWEKFGKIKEFILGTGLYEYVGTLPKQAPPEKGLDIVFKRKDF